MAAAAAVFPQMPVSAGDVAEMPDFSPGSATHAAFSLCQSYLLCWWGRFLSCAAGKKHSHIHFSFSLLSPFPTSYLSNLGCFGLHLSVSEEKGWQPLLFYFNLMK